MQNSDLYTVCYQAIARIFRPALSDYVSARLKSAFGEAWEGKVKELFTLESWEQNDRRISILKAKGVIADEPQRFQDRIDINHFVNVFEKYHDVLIEGNEEQRRTRLQSTLRHLQTIKDYRDPTAHPPGDDLPPEDAFLLIDSARRVCDMFGLESSAKLTELSKQVWKGSELEPISSMLPPRESIVPNFIGRTGQLNDLWSWLVDRRSGVHVLSGDGGKGKSAVAYHFAEQVVDNPPDFIQFVMWVSAKRRAFNSGEVFELEQDFQDLATLLDAILNAYGASEDEKRAPLDEKQEWCLQYLELLPALLIVDDVDSLEGTDDDALLFLMTKASAGASKVLVTTRRVPFGAAAATTVVPGFKPDEEGYRFVETRLLMFRFPSDSLSLETKNEILEVTDGTPLFIEDLIRLIRSGVSTKKAIEAWRERDGDAAREYALRREFEALSAEAQRALLAFALHPGPTATREVAIAAAVSEQEMIRAISELQGLFLVVPDSSTGEEILFSVPSNTRSLALRAFGDRDEVRRIDAAWKGLAGTGFSSYRNRAVTNHVRTAVLLSKQGRCAEAEEYVKTQALAQYPEDSDLLGILGYIYRRWTQGSTSAPRLADARDCFQRAAQLQCRNENMYKEWVDLELDEREWTAALAAIDTGLSHRPNSTRLQFMKGYTLCRLAHELKSADIVDRAMEKSEEADRVLADALIDPELWRGLDDRRINGRIRQSRVLNFERMIDLTERGEGLSYERPDRAIERTVNVSRKREAIRRESLLTRLHEEIRLWNAEHPGDPLAQDIDERLKRKFPTKA